MISFQSMEQSRKKRSLYDSSTTLAGPSKVCVLEILNSVSFFGFSLYSTWPFSTWIGKVFCCHKYDEKLINCIEIASNLTCKRNLGSQCPAVAKGRFDKRLNSVSLTISHAWRLSSTADCQRNGVKSFVNFVYWYGRQPVKTNSFNKIMEMQALL